MPCQPPGITRRARTTMTKPTKKYRPCCQLVARFEKKQISGISRYSPTIHPIMITPAIGEKQENRISLGKKIVDLSHLFHIAISLHTNIIEQFSPEHPIESTATFGGHLYLGEVVNKQPGREYSFLPDSAYKGA